QVRAAAPPPRGGRRPLAAGVRRDHRLHGLRPFSLPARGEGARGRRYLGGVGWNHRRADAAAAHALGGRAPARPAARAVGGADVHERGPDLRALPAEGRPDAGVRCRRGDRRPQPGVDDLRRPAAIPSSPDAVPRVADHGVGGPRAGAGPHGVRGRGGRGVSGVRPADPRARSCGTDHALHRRAIRWPAQGGIVSVLIKEGREEGSPDALAGFHPLVRRWFVERFGTPTTPQPAGWREIATGRDVVIAAPTGSGKTLAAFLWALNRLVLQAEAGQLADPAEGVYASPA